MVLAFLNEIRLELMRGNYELALAGLKNIKDFADGTEPLVVSGYYIPPSSLRLRGQRGNEIYKFCQISYIIDSIQACIASGQALKVVDIIERMDADIVANLENLNSSIVEGRVKSSIALQKYDDAERILRDNGKHLRILGHLDKLLLASVYGLTGRRQSRDQYVREWMNSLDEFNACSIYYGVFESWQSLDYTGCLDWQSMRRICGSVDPDCPWWTKTCLLWAWSAFELEGSGPLLHQQIDWLRRSCTRCLYEYESAVAFLQVVIDSGDESDELYQALNRVHKLNSVYGLTSGFSVIIQPRDGYSIHRLEKQREARIGRIHYVKRLILELLDRRSGG